MVKLLIFLNAQLLSLPKFQTADVSG